MHQNLAIILWQFNCGKNGFIVMISGADVVNKFYSSIKHSDWLLQFVPVVITNKSALFQCSIAILLKNWFMTLAQDPSRPTVVNLMNT